MIGIINIYSIFTNYLEYQTDKFLHCRTYGVGLAFNLSLKATFLLQNGQTDMLKGHSELAEAMAQFLTDFVQRGSNNLAKKDEELCREAIKNFSKNE